MPPWAAPLPSAARDAWALVKTSGVDAILNDMIIHTAVGAPP